MDKVSEPRPVSAIEPAQAASSNTLLAAIPDEEFALLIEDSTVVSFAARELLYEDGDPITDVYFPLTAMVSIITRLSDGTSLEAMTAGTEAFVGLPLINGIEHHRSTGMCQVAGEFLSIPAASFTDTLVKAPALEAILRRYAQFAHEVVTQSAACNGVHLIEQRCARWLLTTSDAVEKSEFKLTQEFLSQMLAVRRAGVTVAMGSLERKSLISHRYATVKILDREGLKSASCECYQTIRAKARDLLS